MNEVKKKNTILNVELKSSDKFVFLYANNRHTWFAKQTNKQITKIYKPK